MNNVMTMLKRHWMILVLTVIALAALPTMWFFSNGWYQGLISQLEKKVSGDYAEVTKAKMEYSLTSPTGEKVQSVNTEVNAAMTRAYVAIGEKMQQQTGAVSTAALEFNKAGKSLLVPGLFPQPPELEKQSKPNEFARAYINQHPRLLASINAGMPPVAADLAQQLNEIAARKRDEVRVNSGRTDLDQAEKDALAKELLATRLGTYQTAAAKAQVYADVSVFDGVSAAQSDKTPTLARTWDWQERLWLHQDICSAVKLVNGDSAGRGVPGSVIKRIVRIVPESASYLSGSEDKTEAKPFEAGVDKAPSDFTYSITGRRGGPGSNNKWYDVRNCMIELVADAKRLPAFIDALAATNFMSVVDIDLKKVDPLEDLRDGFYYGDSGVVRANIVVETVWFREWREQDMPMDVKRAMAMDQAAPAAEVAPTSAPAPRRNAPPPNAGGDDAIGTPRGKRPRGGGE